MFEIVLIIVLVSLAICDWRWKLLPVEIMAAAAGIFAVWNLFIGRLPFRSIVIGLLVAVVFLGLQVWISRGQWLGAGDPWLGAILGAALGWPMVAVSFYFTYLLGGLVALFYFLSGQYRRGKRVPFAPLLAAGGLLALLFGQPVAAWFSRIIFG